MFKFFKKKFNELKSKPLAKALWRFLLNPKLEKLLKLAIYISAGAVAILTVSSLMAWLIYIWFLLPGLWGSLLVAILLLGWCTVGGTFMGKVLESCESMA